MSSLRDGPRTRSCLCTAVLAKRRDVRETVLKNDLTVEVRIGIDRDEIGIAETTVVAVIKKRVVIASSAGDGSRRFHTPASTAAAWWVPKQISDGCDVVVAKTRPIRNCYVFVVAGRAISAR